MVCMMSRTGRMARHARSLRAARMPSGTPMTAQNRTEVTIIARVVMVSGQ